MVTNGHCLIPLVSASGINMEDLGIDKVSLYVGELSCLIKVTAAEMDAEVELSLDLMKQYEIKTGHNDYTGTKGTPILCW